MSNYHFNPPPSIPEFLRASNKLFLLIFPIYFKCDNINTGSSLPRLYFNI